MDVPQNRDQMQVLALRSTGQSEPGMEDSEETVTENIQLGPYALPEARPTLLCHWDIYNLAGCIHAHS